MRVADICTPLTVHIDPAASIRDAARLMRERHVGAIVVVEKQDGQCVPIGMLISQHPDGQFISHTIRHFKLDTIIGSSSRGGGWCGIRRRRRCRGGRGRR